ncbi:hypothetical protein F5Y12DRAFT_298487 [Xylaria sp. FL1777]|nr:hypothetical protein F5Y12DRAFT_298487 [Xylaria sp. FL1777]
MTMVSGLPYIYYIHMLHICVLSTYLSTYLPIYQYSLSVLSTLHYITSLRYTLYTTPCLSTLSVTCYQICMRSLPTDSTPPRAAQGRISARRLTSMVFILPRDLPCHTYAYYAECTLKHSGSSGTPLDFAGLPSVSVSLRVCWAKSLTYLFISLKQAGKEKKKLASREANKQVYAT